MTQNTSPATLVADARAQAGLSQRALARLAGTAQSVVARIESGQSSPTWQTLSRLLAAAGFVLRAEIIRSTFDNHMLDDVARIRALSPEQRLIELRNTSHFVVGARRV